MPVDPELQARVLEITGADPSQAPDPGELDQLTARALGAVGLDSPAATSAPVAIYAVDMLGRIAVWNAASEELFGYTADEILGEAVPFLPDDELPGGIDGLERLMAGEVIEGVEYSPVHKDGHRLEVMTSASLLRDEHGAPAAILAFAVDLTPKRAAARALDRAHHKWKSMLMNVSDTVTILDAQCRIIETTGDFDDVLGYPTESWVGSSGFDYIHPDDRPTAAAMWEEVLADPSHEHRAVFRMRHQDGHYEVIEFSVVSLLHDPVIKGIVLTTRNVTPEQQAEALLADEAAVLELIAQDAPLDETLPAIARLVEEHCGGAAAILLLRPDGKALDIGAPGSVPTPFLDVLALAPVALSGGNAPFDLRRTTVVTDIQNDPRAVSVAPHAASAGIRAGWSVPIIENRSDELLGIIATYYPEVREPSEHALGVSSVASHLASIAIERDRWQRELFHQARHHELTGLPNRSVIMETLDAALERARERHTEVAVMFIDLDRFKVVNDSLGHVAGDTLLVRFGGRLSTLVRPGDFVGHFGADAFVVILEDTHGADDVRFVAHRLELSLSEPFALDEGEVFLSASIGVASSTGDDTSATLIQHADAAMFRAKELGRNRMEIFDSEMRTRVNEQLRIDRELRLAVERDELTVHYQPKVELGTGRIIGAEALLRWHHPDNGLTPAADFLEVAEDTGIIVRIGGWALEQAVAQARVWVDTQAVPADGFLISVNVSARQLGARGLTDLVRGVLAQHDWPPEQLVLELTESILIDDREATLDVLTELKSIGVKLAIDDFGTGFSSLNYLHRFPVDIVKIDQSFVTNLGPEGAGSPVATAIMHMAHALGLTAAAEGVEEAQQLAGLRALGCDVAQGHLFARALPADDLAALVRRAPSW